MKTVIRIISVKPGVKIITLMKTLAQTGMGLAKAKEGVDGLLAGRAFDVELASVEEGRKLETELLTMCVNAKVL